MFPPKLDLADGKQESGSDPWVQQQMEEAMRHLEVLPSPLLLKQMEREAPTSSSRRKKRRRRAPSCFSAGEEVGPMPADVRAAASNLASSSVTAQSPRLAAAPPMPSSLALVQCSVATPDELEERLRFFARQIKSFRRTSLLYSSPELREKIRQLEEDYRTAIRQFYCRPRQVSRAPLLPSRPRQISRELLLSSPRQVSREPPLCRPSLPEPPPHATEDIGRGTPRLKSSGVPAILGSSLWGSRRRLGSSHRGSRNTSAQVIGGPGDASAQVIRGLGDASAQATEGHGDASAPAKATQGPSDASAPAHTTESHGDASAPAQATEGHGDASAPAQATEGPGDTSAPSHVLFPEPCDKGIEDEPPAEPFPERFEKELILILPSEPRDEGFEEEAPPDTFSESPVGTASVSEGPIGAASVSEGAVGAASSSEGLPGTMKSKPDSQS
ncbi:hypothetical protein CRENBAI_002880 [Crenichthys baileyi]|uniref:Uncharacterized protein n=1 Tax=Crenichthys baileyi TaxID=28760 RepID=A0AAV9R5R0_9TELE